MPLNKVKLLSLLSLGVTVAVVVAVSKMTKRNSSCLYGNQLLLLLLLILDDKMQFINQMTKLWLKFVAIQERETIRARPFNDERCCSTEVVKIQETSGSKKQKEGNSEMQ